MQIKNMLKNILENKNMVRPADNDAELQGFFTTGEKVTLADLENARNLQLQLLAIETDPDKLNAGVVRLAAINAAITKFGEVEYARAQARAARLKFAEAERQSAAAGAQNFRENVMLISNAVLARNHRLTYHVADDDQLPNFLKKLNAYFHVLFEALKFEDAQRQADEILTASLQRREWELVIRVPKVKGMPTGDRISTTGEFIS